MLRNHGLSNKLWLVYKPSAILAEKRDSATQQTVDEFRCQSKLKFMQIVASKLVSNPCFEFVLCLPANLSLLDCLFSSYT